MDAEHKKKKLTLRIVGYVLAIIGLVLAVIGFVDFFTSIASESGMPTKFWMMFLGMPLLAVGIMLTIFSYRGEITRYIKNESVPIINEASEELEPAITSVTSAVHDAMTEPDSHICQQCGALNAGDARYCTKCGALLYNICPVCGEEVNTDDTYCGKCGTKIYK